MPSAAFTSPLPTLPSHARARGRARVCATASPAAPTATGSTTLQRFLSWFRSDFDNYYQAAADRASGASRSRHHEHIHCRLQPLRNERLAPAGHAALFATYYYNGNADVVYRTRLYTVRDDGDALEMRIYKLAFVHGLLVAKAKGRFDDVDMGSVNDATRYEHLDGSQIVWHFVDAPHAGSGFVANGPHFVGTMRDGGYTAANSLRYEDELVLTKEDLWVSERVFNADGVMVGGHPDGVPHKMRRVRRGDEIKWTLDWNAPEVHAPE